MDVLNSRSAESELGKSSARSRGDAAGITLSLSTPLDHSVHHADLAKRRKGFLGSRRMKIKLRRLRGNERTVDAPMLLFARQGDSLRGISQSASQSDADQWLKAWMLYLSLADSVGVYGAVHVDCGAVLLSQNAFLTPFPMLRISECRLCLCQNAKFKALQHVPSPVISRLCISLSMSYLVRTGLAVRHRHSRGRTYRQVDTEACVRACVRMHTHTHTHTHTAGPDGDSPRRVTRAWDSSLLFGRTLLDTVTMRDLHVSILVLAVGLALSLHCDMLAFDLIICLARPQGSWIFFLWAKPCRTCGHLHIMMSVIRSSCIWKYRLCFKCHLSGTFFPLCFTCSMHTHPFSETCHSSCYWFFF